ncbi:MAG: WD40 repeat domain-containing protein [Chloroflexota bacterium]
MPVAGFTRALAWLPNSQALLVGDGSGGLYRIDPGSASGTELPALGDHSAMNSLAVSPDGTELAVGFDDGLVLLCDPSTGIARRTLTRGRSVGALAWAPNGQVLAETSLAFDVSLWSRQGTRLAHLNIGYDMNGISWSPDGQELAAGSDDHTLKVWQVTPAQGASHSDRTSPASYMGR